MVNKVILLGNLGKDPVVKRLESGTTVANFSIATSETWKDKDGNKQEKTEWHNIVIFGKLAEVVEKYVKKGSKIYIEGKISYETYEKEGEKKYATKIIADSMTMLGGGNSTEGRAEPKASEPTQGEQEVPTTEGDEEDLPF